MLFDGPDAHIHFCECAFVSSTAYISTNMLFDGLVVSDAAASHKLELSFGVVESSGGGVNLV